MPLDEARRVRWPFDGREPMGAMFDRGALTRSKLQWAAEKAKWPEVKRAAQRLLEELERREASVVPASASPPAFPLPVAPLASLAAALPTSVTSGLAPAVTPTLAGPPRYGASVVVASEYLEAQESEQSALLFTYVGVAIGLLFISAASMVNALTSASLLVLVFTPLVNVIAWAWLLIVIRSQLNSTRSFRTGRKGEDQVVEQLRAALDSRWTIYRNLQLPQRLDDLDLVLVGPGGVWAVQVKAFSMPLRFHAGRWEYQRGRGWARCQAKHDPAQVSGQAKRLNAYLKENGVERWVERAIALTGRQPYDLVKGSEVPVWMSYNIETRARQLVTRYPPQADELARINQLLGRRAVEQRAVEEARRGRGR